MEEAFRYQSLVTIERHKIDHMNRLSVRLKFFVQAKMNKTITIL